MICSHILRLHTGFVGSVAGWKGLKLHWQRTCWVIHMWNQADQNTMVLHPISQYGWNIRTKWWTHICLGHHWEHPSSAWQGKAPDERVQVYHRLHNIEMHL